MKKGAFLRLLLGCYVLAAALFINNAQVQANSYPPCSGKATANHFQQLTDNITQDLERIIARGSDIPEKIGSLVSNVTNTPLLIIPGQKACRIGPPEPIAIVRIIKVLAVRILGNKDSQLDKGRLLQPVCDSFVDIDRMGARSLGHPYKELRRDPDRKKRYLHAFGIYFKNGVFRVAMEKFSNQDIKITGQEITTDWARVNALALGVTYSGYVRETTPIVLYFERQNNRWKIIDFQVAGFRYTAHNRTTFGEYYDRGFEELITFLESRSAAEKQLPADLVPKTSRQVSALSGSD